MLTIQPKLALAAVALAFASFAAAQDQPRVYVESRSSGNTWAAVRNQTMEVSKDFQLACPDVRVTAAPDRANYTVRLNHIELGLLVRDNQMQVLNLDGDVVMTREGGSILQNVKTACTMIRDDWNRALGVVPAVAETEREAAQWQTKTYCKKYGFVWKHGICRTRQSADDLKALDKYQDCLEGYNSNAGRCADKFRESQIDKK